MKKIRKQLVQHASVMLAATASPATAQAPMNTTAVPPADSHPHEKQVMQLDEIVVTANRRSQLLGDVGASVDSLEGSSLQARGVRSTSDLQKLVPGFTAADTGVNFPAYSLRGIGLNDPSLASNSTVAISVDEIPLPYTAMSQGEILDVQHVEILKGPQGTLYGQNATGGAINYIANKPDDTLSTGWNVGYGRFNTTTAGFHIGGRLGETLAARLALNGTRAGAWQRNFTRDDELGEVERSSARMLLNWQPSSRLEIDFNLNGWIDRSDTQATQIVAFRAQVAANAHLVPDVFSSPITPTGAQAANWNPDRDYSRNDEFYQPAIKATYELDDSTRLTSITAYSDYNSNAFNDRDGLVPADYEFATDGRIKSLYQEVRVYQETEALAWSLGANFRKDRTRDFQATDVSRATNTFVAGSKLNTVDFYSNQNVKTYAAFADGELRIASRWSLLTGIRYTRDRRDFAGSTCDNGDGETSAVYTLLANRFRTQLGLPQLPAIAPAECVTLSADTFTPGVVSESLDEDNTAFRTQINFKPTDYTLLYSSYSRGFKAGSFPTLSAVFAPGYGPATQEQVDAAEVGFNTSFLNRRARVHGAGFYYDYHDKQFRGRVLDPVIGNLSKLVNIPRSVIKGFELDLVTSPIHGLTLQSSVSWLHTEVREFTGVNLFGETEDFAGQTLPYTPRWSANAGGEYAWNVSDGIKAFVGTDIVHRSRTSGFLGRDRAVDVDAYTTLDLRAGITLNDDRWQILLWGNNVTDTYYFTAVMRAGDTVIAYAARPVTYGISLSFNN